IERTVNEKNFLQAIDHPLIVNAKHNFWNNDNAYIAFDLSVGGELQRTRHLFKNSMKILLNFIELIFLALNFLHEVGIV
ncbi:hypothetical protein HELRODRAFT_74434, partial [Helobdella robusta]|uniref:Protein kinase domain-containing protein n=1 Tax=Helobdella robusta TaxID=6412 RepID=T1G1R0_HELRO